MQTILATLQDSAYFISLNRPRRGNSFNRTAVIELTDVFRSLKQNRKIRSIVLTGQGRNFCTGTDLQWMASAGRMPFEKNLDDAYLLVDLYDSLLNCDLPIIARAHGSVCGSGVGLLAASDIVICDHSVMFSLPEIQLGLIPGLVTPVLIRKIGERRYSDYATTGRRWSAEEALADGFVQFVGTEATADQYLNDWISRFEKADTQTIQKLKSASPYHFPISKDSLIEMAHLTAQRRASKEAQERLSHFLSHTK